jgi:hypothetical protein
MQQKEVNSKELITANLNKRRTGLLVTKLVEKLKRTGGSLRGTVRM